MAVWGEEYIPNKNVTYGIACDSIMLNVGFQNGDKLVSFDGKPVENFSKVTKAMLPSFDGFFLVFGDNTQRFIVTPILWLEVIFILVNGGMFWLLLKDRGREQLSADEIRRLSGELKKR